MQLKSIYLSFLFIILSKSLSLAQELSPQVKREVDSLRSMLRFKMDDTIEIRLKYSIGLKSFLLRIGYWDSLLVSARNYKLNLLELRILDRLSYINFMQGDNTKASTYLKESLKICEKNGYEVETMSIIHKLTMVTFGTESSLDYCYKGLKIAEKLQNVNWIAKYNLMIADMYYGFGNFSKSLLGHFRSLKINREKKDSVNTCLDFMRIGNDYMGLKDTNKAINSYFEARNYSSSFKYNHVSNAGDLYNALGASFAILKIYDSAIYYCSRAYALQKSISNKNGISSALASLSQTHFFIGNNNKAKKFAEEDLELAKELNNSIHVAEAALLLKRIYKKENNMGKALEFNELYMEMRDSSNNEKNRKQVLEKEFNYNLEKKESENKLLAQQNQIQSLQLNQNKYLLVGVCALLLLVLLIGYLFLRQNKLKTQQQSSELEQKLLRSQMNPHFIFNSLQAIQNFIMKNEKKEAFMYLSSFADITRNVLENSRMEAIPLKKEISLLENYLLLQKLRFQERFVYAIHVDEAIDLENTTIAPMLSQPFIENAVEHGMYNIENDGRIDVYYTIKNDFLLMEIVDNGHGMGSSGSSGKQHQSLAMQITKERVTLMNKKSKKKTEFKINDAYPEQIKRRGVKISFTIPLNLSV